jgi:hypothetical protein
MSDTANPATDDIKDDDEQRKLVLSIYEEVGRGISTWAAAEMRLVQIVARLLGTAEDKAGLILYSINNFYTWVTIIDGLFAASEFAEAKKLWSNLASDLKSQNDIRVRLAHQSLHVDIWKNGQGDLKFVISGLRPVALDTRPKQKGLRPLELSEIKKFTDTVASLQIKLAKVVQKLNGPKPSPGTPVPL